jgi:hypothetical protein
VKCGGKKGRVGEERKEFREEEKREGWKRGY